MFEKLAEDIQAMATEKLASKWHRKWLSTAAKRGRTPSLKEVMDAERSLVAYAESMPGRMADKLNALENLKYRRRSIFEHITGKDVPNTPAFNSSAVIDRMQGAQRAQLREMYDRKHSLRDFIAPRNEDKLMSEGVTDLNKLLSARNSMYTPEIISGVQLSKANSRPLVEHLKRVDPKNPVFRGDTPNHKPEYAQSHPFDMSPKDIGITADSVSQNGGVFLSGHPMIPLAYGNRYTVADLQPIIDDIKSKKTFFTPLLHSNNNEFRRQMMDAISAGKYNPATQDKFIPGYRKHEIIVSPETLSSRMNPKTFRITTPVGKYFPHDSKLVAPLDSIAKLDRIKELKNVTAIPEDVYDTINSLFENRGITSSVPFKRLGMSTKAIDGVIKGWE